MLIAKEAVGLSCW